MMQILYVGFGGFFGAISRFLVANVATSYFGTFPYGTLIVNVTGSFILAFINYAVLLGRHVSPDIRSFTTIGFIGAYTTMSTFSYESMRYLDQGEYWNFTLNILLNVGLCLFAIALGRYCAVLLSR